jgi:hypothetical protein
VWDGDFERCSPGPAPAAGRAKELLELPPSSPSSPGCSSAATPTFATFSVSSPSLMLLGVDLRAAAAVADFRASSACFRSKTETPPLVVAARPGGQGLPLIAISAQLELFCPTYAQHPTHDFVLELLKLSSNVNECKPQPAVPGPAAAAGLGNGA